MADNKGVEDIESPAAMEPAPQKEDSGDSSAKEQDAVIVIEPNTKDEEDGHSQGNTSQVPTPTSAGGEGSGSGSAGAGGDGSSSSSPAGTANAETNEPPATGETAGTAGISPAPTTEMSPSPQALAAPPNTPVNLLDTCAVCKQSLQNRDCEPKLLPCLHSFCLRCIPQPERQISVQVPGPHGQDTHIVNVMRCTVCHQDYKQNDLVDNYFVKDTSEGSCGSDENSVQVCTSCEDNAGAVGFCVECGEWLCKTCIEAHQRVKFTKDHKIRKKEEVSSESVETSGQRPVFCPIHKQEALKLFCETCDTLTCRDCQLLEHKEHRYQFLEEAFQNQKGIIETFMAKLQEKKTYVQYSASQVQSRIKEVNETHKKVEHEIKIAVFTLINEINKKGKSLLQQLENVTKERSMKLLSQQRDINVLAQQISHVLSFTHWAISNGSSTALLYSKRLITYQLRYILKARLDPVPPANGAVRFFCDPTFWAKNVVNLGNLVIEKMPPSVHPPNVIVGQVSPGHGHGGKHPGQINLAQLRLQHMQQAAYAQKQQQQQHQHQHQQQQIQQQMRIASQMVQHPRQGGPQMVQQQPPRLISMPSLQRGGVNGSSHMFPSHSLRIGPGQGRMQPGQPPRHNGQQYPMMQPQLQRQHSNPGHAGPFPVASLHNASVANPTSPTSGSMAGGLTHRGPTSPLVGTIELIPSVTNPENLPCLPDIPPIQLEDAGSSTLDNLLSRYISASTHPPLGPAASMNPSPGPSTHSPGSSGLSNSHTPVRPSSTSSTGSRGSCGSAGRVAQMGVAVEQVKVKQEPGVEEDCGFQGPAVKVERSKDGARSACMMSSPESSLTPPLPVLGAVSTGSVQDVLKTLGENVKAEPRDEEEGGACSRTGGEPSTKGIQTKAQASASASASASAATAEPPPEENTHPAIPKLTNGDAESGEACSLGSPPITCSARSTSGAQGNSHKDPAGKDDDPNEDWCAVCQNGGELLCCDKCPKVFHITCHIPTLSCSPSGDWLCTFCRSLTAPEVVYDCDGEKQKDSSDQGLSPEDQRRCQRLLLYIFCHELSVEFQEPVSSSVPNYYKIIKQPMDLNTVKQKLQQLQDSQHYRTPLEFVSDVRLVFSNCAKYNEMSRIIQVYDEEKQINVQADSEVAEAGKTVSLHFEEKLKELFPDRTFPLMPEGEQRPPEEDEDVTEDSDDDFVQPKRKRLKPNEKPMHIK
ncbi:E3 ubiquitin-protein ligase TRIM33 isoform X2 [Paramormyrops kingsleyae]|uniref:E3 ubiquitin-protein ligase TRIM33 isoform X2 n=1 Tax=Paramormyrops kingsleyae TaxID=1676925 RepID=UPI000CD5D82F|nr:E3 ubiquitin-protein ligase TRIM33 isoform X2 [Paramormyrops kingsleyae]